MCEVNKLDWAGIKSDARGAVESLVEGVQQLDVESSPLTLIEQTALVHIYRLRNRNGVSKRGTQISWYPVVHPEDPQLSFVVVQLGRCKRQGGRASMYINQRNKVVTINEVFVSSHKSQTRHYRPQWRTVTT